MGRGGGRFKGRGSVHVRCGPEKGVVGVTVKEKDRKDRKKENSVSL